MGLKLSIPSYASEALLRYFIVAYHVAKPGKALAEVQ